MDSSPQIAALREAITCGDPARAMPALAGLRDLPAEQAIPLLLLGLEQEVFLVRSLSCAGLGVKRSEAGWQALERALAEDSDVNVRSEAAGALVNYGLARAWPPLLSAFRRESHWLLRCSVLAAVAEHPEAEPALLLELARLAVLDGDGTVRAGGAEILSLLARQGLDGVRDDLAALQRDPDHRVVAAALNGLQA